MMTGVCGNPATFHASVNYISRIQPNRVKESIDCHCFIIYYYSVTGHWINIQKIIAM